MDYRIAFDYHTHSTFSDGKSTIREIVLAARKLGLSEVGIADHGPGQIEHGIRMDEVSLMRQAVTDLSKEFDDIKIYLGVEANIQHTGNCIDISKEESDLFDFVIAGYHNSVPDAYSHENWNDWHRGIRSKRRLIENTDMTLKAIYENNLKILAHPGGNYHVDMLELAKACADKGTWMEINASNRNLTTAQIKECMKTDVKFVLSSDAHTAYAVGDVRLAAIRAKEANLDINRIVNLLSE